MRTQIVGTAQDKARSRLGGLKAVLGLGLALVIAVAAIIVLRPAPEEVPLTAPERVAPQAADPAQKWVLSYVRAHLAALQPEPDAAQQGVLGYLRAHGAQATPSNTEGPWDPAVRAVFDYLEAHGW